MVTTTKKLNIYDTIAVASKYTLFFKRTDGGAEYLCTRAIEGTNVGDVKHTIIRLDGGAEVF